jgi:hypothetical protein
MEEAVSRLLRLINNHDNSIKEKLILCQLMERQSYCSGSLRPPARGAG